MRLLSLQDLHERGIPYSRQWLHELVRAGKFPRPVKLGARRNVWVKDEIDAWVKAAADDRDQQSEAARRSA